MNKKSLCLLLAILTVICFAFPLVASAETRTAEPPDEELIGTIIVTEDGEVVVEPTRAAAALTCSLVKSGTKYYAYAKITTGLPASLKVSVYLKNSSGTTLASNSNTGTGTVLTTQTTAITLSPGIYTVSATGSADSTPVSLTKQYSVS